MPKFWSQTATKIVAQKYFRGHMSSLEREPSTKQMIGRIADIIGAWAAKGYFEDEKPAETFDTELKAILVNQLASFNSAVWFDVGFGQPLESWRRSTKPSSTSASDEMACIQGQQHQEPR